MTRFPCNQHRITPTLIGHAFATSREHAIGARSRPAPVGPNDPVSFQKAIRTVTRMTGASDNWGCRAVSRPRWSWDRQEVRKIKISRRRRLPAGATQNCNSPVRDYCAEACSPQPRLPSACFVPARRPRDWPVVRRSFFACGGVKPLASKDSKAPSWLRLQVSVLG